MEKKMKYIIALIAIVLSSLNLISFNNDIYYYFVDIIIFASTFLLLLFDKETKDLLLIMALIPFVIYNYASKGIVIYILGTISILVGCIIRSKKFEIKYNIRFLDLYFLVIIFVSALLSILCSFFIIQALNIINLD